jgi:hypothetical protein
MAADLEILLFIFVWGMAVGYCLRPGSGSHRRPPPRGRASTAACHAGTRPSATGGHGGHRSALCGRAIIEH